jgi:hypothetical protein
MSWRAAGRPPLGAAQRPAQRIHVNQHGPPAVQVWAWAPRGPRARSARATRTSLSRTLLLRGPVLAGRMLGLGLGVRWESVEAGPGSRHNPQGAHSLAVLWGNCGVACPNKIGSGAVGMPHSGLG